MIKVVNCMLCVFWSPFKKSKEEKEDLPKSSRDLFHVCCWCECLNWSRCFIGSLNMAVSNSITNSNFLLKLPFLKKETKKKCPSQKKTPAFPSPSRPPKFGLFTADTSQHVSCHFSSCSLQSRRTCCSSNTTTPPCLYLKASPSGRFFPSPTWPSSSF